MINSKKSSILSEKGLEAERIEAICNILGMVECVGDGKYLGLPYMVRRTKTQTI